MVVCHQTILTMNMSVNFLGAAIFFLCYGIKYRKKNERDIRFPFTYSILFSAFSAFEVYNYIIGKLLVGLIIIILIVIDFFFTKRR